MTPDAAVAANTSPAGSGTHPSSDAAALHAFGFWLYLMSDLVLFAALFAVYVVLGHNYAGGPTGKDLFDLTNAFVETMLLLSSSAMMGFAMLAVHGDRKRLSLAFLAVTFVLGAAFVVMEVAEFHGMVGAGHGPDRSAFLSSYFTLVGAHGAHVTLGLLWLAVTSVQVLTKSLTTPVKSRLLRLSMFWHFLDIVWIGIFTVVYLMGRL